MVSRQQQTWPAGIDPGEFLRVCREVMDAAADAHADLPGSGARRDFMPEDVRALLAEETPEEGEAAGAPPADWRERVMHTLTALADSRGLLSKYLVLAGRLHGHVREHPDFEVLHEPTLYLYCFRYVPNAFAERQEESAVQTMLDSLNQEIVEAVRRNGLALVMTTRVRDRVAIRMSVCSHRTLTEDIDATFEAVARWGRLLYKTLCPPRDDMEARLCLSESHSSPTEVSAT